MGFRTRQVFYSIFLIFLTLSLAGTAYGVGAPTPHNFYGITSDASGAVLPGATVSVTLNSDTTPVDIQFYSASAFTQSVASEADGYYDINIKMDNPDTADTVEGAVEGDIVHIFIYGTEANQTSGGTVVIVSGNSDELNISPPDLTGPTTSNLESNGTATLWLAEGTASISLTAKVNDVGNGGSNIQAAEYFVGATDPGTGAGIAMTAVNTFDSATEFTTATVDTSAWTAANTTYTLNVRGQDAQGNWGSNQSLDVTVFVPLAAPTFSPATGTYNGSQTVTITPATGAASTYYTTDDTDPDNTKTSGTTAIVNGADNTSVTLKSVSYDNGGNIGVIGSATYTFDKSAPIVTITTPSTAEHVTASSYTFTGTVSDSISGVAKVEVSLDNGTTINQATVTNGTWSYTATLTKGANTLVVTGTDNAGNASTEITSSVVTYYPALAITVDGADVTGNQIYVPNITGNNTKAITVSGGSDSFIWALTPTTFGDIAASGNPRDFTAIVGKEGTAVLTVTDTVDNLLSPATLTINVISLGVTGDKGIVVNTATTYTVVGAVGNITWSVTSGTDVAGTPAPSETNNVTATVTPAKTGPFTLRATDGSTGAFAETMVEAVDPIVVTPTILVVSDDTTLQINAAGGKGSGTAANYTWSVDGNGTIDNNGLFTPTAGDGVRHFTATATDKTYTGINAKSASITIIDPLAITDDPTNKVLKSEATNTYKFTGGTGAVTWTATAGTIDTNGNFTAPTVTTDSEVVTITAKDSQFTDVKATTTVTVYANVTITNKPTTTPTVLSGASSDTFTVAGGDTDYTWAVTDAAGSSVGTPVTAATFSFTAPTTGNFAGEYTITVSDGKGFSDSFTVKVPIAITPASQPFTELETPNFSVSGTARTDLTWTIVSSADSTTEVSTPADYGTFAPQGAAPTFTPLPGGTIRTFYLYVMVNDDGDDTTIEPPSAHVGPFTIIPVETYTVTISDGNGPIDGSTLTAGDITVAVTSLGKTVTANLTNSNGTVDMILPATGTQHTYVITDNTKTRISQKVSFASTTTAINVTLEDAGDSFTGTITSKMGGGNLSGVKVVAQYTDTSSSIVVVADTMTAADGTYSLKVPASAPSTTYDIIVSKDGFQNISAKDQTPATPGATVDFAIWPTTTVTVTVTETSNSVVLNLTAVPAFDNSDDTKAANAGAQLQVALIDPKGVATGTLGSMTFNATDNSYTIIYSVLENFTIKILADTSADRDVDTTTGDAYTLTTIYSHIVKETVGTGVTGAASSQDGGSQELTANSQTAKVVVPAGSGVVTKDIAIAIRQTPKSDSPNKPTITEGSPSYVYEISATDITTGEKLADTDIKRIEITLPFDTTLIPFGAFEDGTYSIYHATTLTDLESGTNLKTVEVAQIIQPTDYIGTGGVGSVTFWVDSLSFFGIGSISSSGILGSDSRCFIATAAFGSPFEAHVSLLRKFRDIYLLPNHLGNAFVHTYYQLSPPMADFIAQHDTLRAMVRVLLIPLIAVSYMMVNFGALVSMLLFGGLLSLAVLLRHRLSFAKKEATVCN